jgi:hypothetical protein
MDFRAGCAPFQPKLASKRSEIEAQLGVRMLLLDAASRLSDPR